MFSLATNLVVASITVNAVASMGGGAAGWRNVAIVYAIIGLIVNTISVLSVKELPEEEDGKCACGEAFTAGSHQAAACQ